jgi:hypothetical protein
MTIFESKTIPMASTYVNRAEAETGPMSNEVLGGHRITPIEL